MKLVTSLPRYLIGYYNNNLYTIQPPRIIIAYREAILPALALAPTITVIDDTIEASAVFSDKGLGEITRCGFYASRTLEVTSEGIYYDAVALETDIFTAQLTDLETGVFYIAAFAENAAGKVFSEFTTYRNSLGWEGGVIYGVSPNAVSSFVVGSVSVPRTKINQIIVGTTEL